MVTKIISFRCDTSIYDELRCRIGNFRDVFEPMAKKYVKLLIETMETGQECEKIDNRYHNTRLEVDAFLSRLNEGL